MLLDPEGWSLAHRIDDLLPELASELAGHVARRRTPARSSWPPGSIRRLRAPAPSSSPSAPSSSHSCASSGFARRWRAPIPRRPPSALESRAAPATRCSRAACATSPGASRPSPCTCTPTFIWWDVRLQPRLGTVEVRIADAQTTVADVAALAALIQALVRLEATERLAADELIDSPEVLEENRFLAARDGMEARLIDPLGGTRVPAERVLDQVMTAARPHAPGARLRARAGRRDRAGTPAGRRPAARDRPGARVGSDGRGALRALPGARPAQP